jgi:hypothetical protein
MHTNGGPAHFRVQPEEIAKLSGHSDRYAQRPPVFGLTRRAIADRAVTRSPTWAGEKMAAQKETLRIHVNLEIAPGALQAIVANGKALAGRDEKGRYRVDTADLTGEMISRFLMENDFEAYVKDIGNYPRF